MKTAVAATRADDYIPPHGFDLQLQNDRFTHTTQVRHHIERSSGGGGGGGGSSVSSSGFGGSSGGHF